MDAVFHQFQSVFEGLPLPFMEAWGLAGYVVGCGLLVLAYGNLTLRPGGKWGLGWREQAWDDHALKAALTTFVLIMATGYLGSFIVLVPGAQTFESLKDLSVFLCVMLFGYPALVIVPFAYAISDLIEGVPLDFLTAWISGYWINPSCFWMAVLLLGRNPDFRRAATWGRYLVFVAVFLAVEPALWGFLASAQFPGISYYQITPALFFTTVITWLMAPFVLWALLPVVRRMGWYWPEIPQHAREWSFARSQWVWFSGSQTAPSVRRGIPLRLALALPLLTLLLLSVGGTAYVSLTSTHQAASLLVDRYHQELVSNLALRLELLGPHASQAELNRVLAQSSASKGGRAYLLNSDGDPIAVSEEASRNDPVFEALSKAQSPGAKHFSFVVVTAKPLSRETWVALEVPYTGQGDSQSLVTAFPSSSYLGGVQAGQSLSALVFAWGLVIALLVVVVLASVVTAPLERIGRAAQALTGGTWTRVPSSRIGELAILTSSFNTMAEQTQAALERTQASERNFRNIFDGALEGFYRTSPEGEILLANPAMAQMLGYESPEHLTAVVHDTGKQVWYRTEDRKKIVSELEQTSEVAGAEIQMVRLDGSPLWVSLNGRRVVPAEGSPYFEGFILNIDERKRASLDLARHHDHLEELVAVRTKELEAARDAADAANQAKSIFLSNMSHEIRTPMNAVLGYAQLLGHADLPAAARTKVDTILRSGEQLLSLIDEILEMARIESGRVEIHESAFDPKALVDDVANLFQVRVREKGLMLHVESQLPAAVLSDQGKLRQVLINLLSNAVKYTKEGSITFRSFVSGEKLVFEVEDTGIGLEPSERDAVFTPFERTKTGEQVAGGTGLGLAISRKHAELLGGGIEVDSLKGRGSRFVVTIPLRAGAAAPAERRVLPRFPVLAPGQQTLRFLVVDDVDLNRELLRGFIEPLGVIVEDAASGQKAYEMALKNPPDIVLLDLRMPGWDGYETTKRLRELPTGKTMRILGVSASAFDQERKDFLASGINGFIAKPFREEALYDLLAQSGVRFGEAPAAAVAAQDVLPSLKGMPREWMDELRDAVARGSLSQVRDLADRISETNGAAAAWLKKQTSLYDLEAVRALVTEGA